MTVSEYKIRISNKARNYHMEIDWEDGLTVVVPKRWSQMFVDRLLREKSVWVEKHLRKLTREKNSVPEKIETQKMASSKIVKLFDKEVSEAAKIMKITYNNISVRKQKTRWGSCSSRGNLNFNAYLAFAPDAVRQYVIVHELSHRLVANHSSRFWHLVEVYCPDYKTQRAWLRKNGRILVAQSEIV